MHNKFCFQCKTAYSKLICPLSLFYSIIVALLPGRDVAKMPSFLVETLQEIEVQACAPFITIVPIGEFSWSVIRDHPTLSSMEKNPSCEAVTRMVKIFRNFYKTWRFIIVFRRARHWSISLARCIQSTIAHSIPLTFNLNFPPIYAFVFRVSSYISTF